MFDKSADAFFAIIYKSYIENIFKKRSKEISDLKEQND